MTIKYTAFLFSVCLFLACKKSPEETRVAIQPLGTIHKTYLVESKEAIETYYGFKTYILPAIELPKHTFVNSKSPRYRADSLIRFLKKKKQTPSITS